MSRICFYCRREFMVMNMKQIYCPMCTPRRKVIEDRTGQYVKRVIVTEYKK